MIRLSATVVVATALAVQGALAAPGITLVRDGKPNAAIVIGDDASEAVQAAAAEVQEYLKKMSGAELPVIERPGGQSALILLGRNGLRAARASVAGLRRLGDEGFVLRTRGERVIAAGNTDLGTQNAALDLLEQLGCRWFLPGEAGERVPEMRTVTVPPLNKRQTPSYIGRRIWSGYGTRLPQRQRDEYAEWQRHNRMPGSLTGAMGHAYDRIASRRDAKLFAEHPEYFALVDGVRSNSAQICTSHPDIVQRAIEYAKRFFDSDPIAKMVSLSPNDGRGFCECERCLPLGSPSDRALMVANAVAEAIEQDYPNKFVAFYAYAPTAPPPTIEGRRSVIVFIATRFIRPPYSVEQLIEGWSQKVHHIGIREYYSVCAWSWQMPTYDPDEMARTLRYFHEHKALGVSAESEDNFGSRGPNYWVAAKLMWNVNQDLDELLDDYYTTCWGRAAEPMRRYWERWRGKPPVSRDRLARSLRDLQEATERASEPDVRRRLELQKLYLHHVRLYRDYGTTSPGDLAELRLRAEALVRFDWQLLPTHMAMVIPLIDRYTLPRLQEQLPDLTDAEMQAWKAAPGLTQDEIAALFAQDLADIRPLTVERKAFSDDLAPLALARKHARPTRREPARPHYRRQNEFWVLSENGEPITCTMTGGLVREVEAKYELFDAGGRRVAQGMVPPGQTVALSLKVPRVGLYRLTLDSDGAAVLIDWNTTKQVAIAAQQRPMSMIRGSGGPLYFYVPSGTRAFGIGIKTPDRFGRLQVMDSEGTVRLDEAGNYAIGEEFQVDVPAGRDGEVWSLAITRCEDSDLYLFGLPGLLAQRPQALLVPGEVEPALR